MRGVSDWSGPLALLAWPSHTNASNAEIIALKISTSGRIAATPVNRKSARGVADVTLAVV